MSNPISIVCRNCGSRAVQRDAWAEWDETKQEWVLGTVFDAAHCDDCCGDTNLDEVPLLPPGYLTDAEVMAHHDLSDEFWDSLSDAQKAELRREAENNGEPCPR